MLSLFLPISLCLASSFEALAIFYVQKILLIDVIPEQLLILTRALTLIICWGIFLITKNPNEKFDFENLAWFIVPGVFYTISNYITYITLTMISPAMYNLLSNLKIPITIGLSFFFLHRYEFNFKQLIAVILIFLGNTLAFLVTGITPVSGLAVGLMFIYSVCSGCAVVYSEYVLHNRYPDENIFLQNVKFSFWSLISNLSISALKQNTFHWKLSLVHLLPISFMILNGILTSFVVKYQGSIPKTYATSFSTFVSILFSWILWGINSSVFFLIGASISFIGIVIYLQPDNESSPEYQLIPELDLDTDIQNDI